MKYPDYGELQPQKGEVSGVLDINMGRLLGLTNKMEPEEEAEKYRVMLNWLSFDLKSQSRGQNLFLGLRRAPAAIRRHHAYEGGLVSHLLEMANMFDFLWRELSWIRDIPVSSVIKTIINHDLHKAYAYYELVEGDTWKVRMAKWHEHDMLDQDQFTMFLLSKFDIKLSLEEQNALYWSEGGWARVQPKERTPLAVLVYLLDELSGNVLEQLRK